MLLTASPACAFASWRRTGTYVFALRPDASDVRRDLDGEQAAQVAQRVVKVARGASSLKAAVAVWLAELRASLADRPEGIVTAIPSEREQLPEALEQAFTAREVEAKALVRGTSWPRLAFGRRWCPSSGPRAARSFSACSRRSTPPSSKEATSASAVRRTADGASRGRSVGDDGLAACRGSSRAAGRAAPAGCPPATPTRASVGPCLTPRGCPGRMGWDRLARRREQAHEAAAESPVYIRTVAPGNRLLGSHRDARNWAIGVARDSAVGAVRRHVETGIDSPRGLLLRSGR